MNKNIGIIVGIIALAVIVFAVYMSTNKKSIVVNEKKSANTLVKTENGAMVAKSFVVEMKALNSSLQVGKTTFSDIGDKTKVVVEIASGAKDVPQPSHIHTGLSSAPGAILYPLSSVINGKAETILDVPLQTIVEKLPLNIMVHKSVKEMKIFVSGGDLLKEKFPAVMMNNSKDGEVNNKNGVSIEKNGETMMKVGSYESYSPEKVARASVNNNVVLFFRASWCPTCRAVDADIRNNLSKIPENLTILDVNYDNSTVLKQKYGVTYQHTFVQVDKDGNLIKKWSGSPTLSLLVSEVLKIK